MSDLYRIYCNRYSLIYIRLFCCILFVCAVNVSFDGIVGSVCYFVFVFSECVGNSVCVRVVVCECDVFGLLCVVCIFCCFVVFVNHVFVSLLSLDREQYRVLQHSESVFQTVNAPKTYQNVDTRRIGNT